LMTLMAHSADGLVLTNALGLNPADSERHMMLLVAVWCVVALIVVTIFGPTLMRSRAEESAASGATVRK
jgi:uncharacterized protein